MRRGLLALSLGLGLSVAGPARAIAATPAVRVSAAIAPQAILFGDTVEARVDVVVDLARVDPAQVRLSAPLGAWQQVGPTVVRTTGAGPLARRSFSLTIVCLVAACVPPGTAHTDRLPAATVIAPERRGGMLRTTVHWPSLVVASRLPAGAAAAAKPPFELDVAPPPVRPRLSGTTAAWLLGAAAVVLAGLAVGCAVVELRRRRGGRQPESLAPLARALALAREAASRPPADRRRALALLARVVPPAEGDVSSAAAATAWSEAEPSPAQLAELVTRIEEREGT